MIINGVKQSKLNEYRLQNQYESHSQIIPSVCIYAQQIKYPGIFHRCCIHAHNAHWARSGSYSCRYHLLFTLTHQGLEGEGLKYPFHTFSRISWI